ncbi:MAG TPA: RsmE family RNA methyltransferase [Polyangiaceae bacterium]|nr:RsmE family RNA methyltransferase [Polyangiaceae bacterium]
MLRVPVSELTPGETTLDPQASRYVARVHRARVGDDLLLFDPVQAREAPATVLAVTRSSVRCRVGEVRASSLRAQRSVTLVQGIGKGDKLDAIVRDATELGATRVIAAETARGVVKLGERAEERMRRLRRIAVEAARQCGRGDVPEVIGPLPWSAALDQAADPVGLLLCLWERATDPVGPRLRALGVAQPLVFAVGAEGGLEDAEIDAARSLGFAVVSLGPFILRTETVAAAILGAALLTSA